MLCLFNMPGSPSQVDMMMRMFVMVSEEVLITDTIMCVNKAFMNIIVCANKDLAHNPA